MKLTLAKSNAGATRTQWLLIICLVVIAFDFGARYAKKQFAAVPAPKATNAFTNITITVQEPTPEELTNFPAITPPDRFGYSRQISTNVRYPAGTRGQPGQPEVLDTSGPITKRKLPPPRKTGTNSTVFGIRIAVPGVASGFQPDATYATISSPCSFGG